MADIARAESPVSVTGLDDQVSQNPFAAIMQGTGASQSGAKVIAPVDRPSTTANTGIAGRPVPVSATGDRAKANQGRLARRAPRSTVTAASGLFKGYKPSTVRVQYSENKVGVMPQLDKVVEEIALSAGVDVTDAEEANKFLEALVTDIYLNPYSDKQVFDGELVIGDFTLPRVHIRNVIVKYVGTNYRRFARAMASLVVQVMHDNYDTYGEVLDKRMSELNLGTRGEAVHAFDGADALVNVDRSAAQKNAAVKALALSQRASHRSYTVAGSAAAMGDHLNEKSPDVDSV